MALSAEGIGKGRAQGETEWFSRKHIWDEMSNNKVVISATTASLVSTLLGYPLDTIKAHMQASRGLSSGFRAVTAECYREEGLRGFWRGATVPLLSIAVVRTASLTIYTGTKNFFYDRKLFSSGSLTDVGIVSFIAGSVSGSVITGLSGPFELVKIRRQLEVQIAADMGINNPTPLGSWASVKSIVASKGLIGLYSGFVSHSIRDTFGTALYFSEYDIFRQILGRLPSGEQGPPPSWFPISPSLIPFICGSAAGVSSWALVYPIDGCKTNIQKRALSGKPNLGLRKTFQDLLRGEDPSKPQSLRVGILRLYKGLGVSAVRSMLTHGLLWLLIDNVSDWIDQGRQDAFAES